MCLLLLIVDGVVCFVCCFSEVYSRESGKLQAQFAEAWMRALVSHGVCLVVDKARRENPSSPSRITSSLAVWRDCSH